MTTSDDRVTEDRLAAVERSLTEAQVLTIALVRDLTDDVVAANERTERYMGWYADEQVRGDELREERNELLIENAGLRSALAAAREGKYTSDAWGSL